MYEGNNPIALRSQEWLADALTHLLSQRPYQKISVKDICEQADLSRQTFYQIFSSKDDVLRYEIHRVMIRGTEQLKQRQYSSIKEVARDCLAHLREQEYYMNLLLDNHLEYLLLEGLMQSISTLVSKMGVDEEHPRVKHANAFLSGGLLSLLIYWFRTPNRLSEDELASLLVELLPVDRKRLEDFSYPIPAPPGTEDNNPPSSSDTPHNP